MLPTLEIFGKTIAMYGLMILIGIIIGVVIAVVRGKRLNILGDDVLFSSCYAGIGLIVGAKILYIIIIFPDLINYKEQLLSDPAKILPLLSGGFVFYGGLIGALLGYIIYCTQYQLNLIQMLDLLAPSFPIIHGFGRLGCLFAGCCYGIPYEGPFHIDFKLSHVAPNNLALFPTQPVESILNFLTGIVLLIYARRQRKPGKVLGFYVIYYSIMRFVLEFFRGDIIRGVQHGLSTSQWISILLLPVGIWIIYNKNKMRQLV